MTTTLQKTMEWAQDSETLSLKVHLITELTSHKKNGTLSPTENQD